MEQILSLPIEERLRIADLLYLSVEAERPREEPEWLIQELERRTAAYEADPENTLSWEECKAILLERIGK